jgi:hypothetical protein
MMRWAGYIITALAAGTLAFSGVMKFTNSEELIKGMAHLGYPANLAVWLGIVELTCTAVYLFPRTAVLGAILLTGYLGGATATHVRIEEGFQAPVIVGVLVWLGIYLRDERLRALIPLRK